MKEYVIWNVEFGGYRPRDWKCRHGGVFAAERFKTRQAAERAVHRRGDIVHVVKDGIPREIER